MAAIELLNKTLELEPQTEVKKESLDIDKTLNEEAHRKTHTKHFKITQTHTTEGEISEHSDDEELKKGVEVKTEHSKRSCWGACFGKNK